MTPKLALIISPYHVGIHEHRVGKGPSRILAKLGPALDSAGVSYRAATIEPVDDFEGEIGRSFEVLRRIRKETARAVSVGEFPIVLAGNCHSTAAVVSGLADAGVDRSTLDVFWTDAHADAQIPDDNTNGYFDSMGTTMLAGMCWKAHMATLGDQGKHTPFPLSHVTFIGIRDMEDSEKARIVDEGAYCIFGGKAGTDYPTELARRLESVPSDHRSVVHIDLDSLDPEVGHANDYPVPNGLLAKDMLGVCELLATRNPVSLTMASFDPDLKNGSDIVHLAVKSILRFVSPID